MENEVKKIFLTYKILSEIKNNYSSSLLQESSWSEKKRGIVNNLDDTFEKIVNEFKQEMSKNYCYSTFTSGKDTNRKNKQSLHIVGKAVDVRTYDHSSTPQRPYLTPECVKKALNVCNTMSQKYPGLKCVHEKTRSQSSSDFTVPHFHIEYSGEGSGEGLGTSDGSMGSSGYRDPFMANMLGGTLEKITKPVSQQIVNPLLKKIGIVENFEFGADSEIDSSGNMIIKANTGRIKSPVSGEVVRKYSFSCKNQIIIKPENEDYSFRFCGISNPNILPKKINKGYILGTSDNDVEVDLLSKTSSKINWNDKMGKDLIKRKEYKSQEKYHDRFIPDLVDLISSPFKDESGRFELVSPTSGKLPKPWKGVTEENLKKDLQRLKELLK